MSFLIDPISLIAVLLPVLCTQIAASYFRKRHWSEVWLALGIPIGLLGSVVGATGMALFTNFTSVYPASAIMLLTILYGGIVSMLGYFAVKKSKQKLSTLSRRYNYSLYCLYSGVFTCLSWTLLPELILISR